MGHRYPAVRAVYKMCGAAVHLRFSVASSAGPPEEYKAPRSWTCADDVLQLWRREQPPAAEIVVSARSHL